ncbi:sorting nexin-6-like [Oppia nitens]|uniref:sorting nexin-6-like n=1 Tax=Oppia nitens TaxID=1686743 RepID=UPI0023DC3210|nr:sorting nexin-6-like [Oppia nitens]XP_054155819.1 sorting nexin-6-like [Oppia nitens]XP_054155820.1 sorting nexin-6-like [Oppia nitens]
MLTLHDGNENTSSASSSATSSPPPPTTQSNAKHRQQQQQQSPSLSPNSDINNKTRSDTVDLDESPLVVDISDALSERDRVKFTIHTKTKLPEFKSSEFSVVRQHEEFIWLHTSLVDNELYAGFIIPPAPPRPDFDASREKLQKLGEGEGTMTKEEFQKMKQELEAEYLATFKKTVAMHEVFLQRLAIHPKFRGDQNFRIFLEYDSDLSVRGKNKKEKLVGLFSNIRSSADDMLLSTTMKDVDEFFEKERQFLTEYFNLIKDSTGKADRMTRSHKNVADTYIKISSALIQLATVDQTDLETFYSKVSDCLEKARKTEGRISSDEDLKLSDLLRYYMRDTSAAKDLLYRRLRCLANYETANRNLEKARGRNKDIPAAESAQVEASEKFDNISRLAKQELQDYKTRRVAAFRKNLIELAELELKHSKAEVQLLKTCLTSLKDNDMND